MILLRNKLFTMWDETDRLKAMKDSDILAEKKRDTTSAGSMVRSGLVGAGIGAGIGVVGTGVSKVIPEIGKAAGKGSWVSNVGRVIEPIKKAKLGRAAAVGAAVGAGIGATASWLRNRKKNNENRFYNQRLAYAQRQALRRERKDWKTNMTQRDGYTY